MRLGPPAGIVAEIVLTITTVIAPGFTLATSERSSLAVLSRCGIIETILSTARNSATALLNPG